MQNNGKCNYITQIGLLHCEVCRPIAMYTHIAHICYYYTGCSHRHTKLISKWLETSSACSHQKRFNVNQFRPNSLRDVSWNWFGYRVTAIQKSKTVWQLFRQPGCMLKQNDDFYHGVISHLPTPPKTGSLSRYSTGKYAITYNLNQFSRSHEQCEREQFLKTSFSEPIQPN